MASSALATLALDLDALIDLAVTAAEVEGGRKLEKSPKITAAMSHVQVSKKQARAREWTQAEDAFLAAAIGWLEEEDIAAQLGRTKSAVHLHWQRDLHLRAPSKAAQVISALGAARMLGIDGHKTASWVDWGLIPGRLMAGKRKIRLITRTAFFMWACSPANWVYFDPKKVADPHLKRLLRLEAKRWGDEWWSTRQVADHHGVVTSDVKRYLQLGRLHGCRLQFSLGGRHPNRYWSNWKVLRSEATRPGFRFRHYGEDLSTITPRGKGWLRRALKMGLSSREIGRTMKRDAMTILAWTKRYYPKYVRPSGGAGHGSASTPPNGGLRRTCASRCLAVRLRKGKGR